MSTPLDVTNMDSFFGWLFHSTDTDLFGGVGLMVVFLIIFIFGIMMFFNANRFVVFGFMASFLIGLGMVGYTIVGWIAPVGALLAGLLLGLAFIKIFGLG